MENELECLKIIHVKSDKWFDLFIGVITFCEAAGECTIIHVCYGQSYLVSGCLKEITAKINCKKFVRLGRRFLFNPEYFSEIFKEAIGFVVCFEEYGCIYPAPFKGVMNYMSFIRNSKEENCYEGCQESEKTMLKYLRKKVIHKGKINKLLTWVWTKTGH